VWQYNVLIQKSDERTFRESIFDGDYTALEPPRNLRSQRHFGLTLIR